MEIIVNKEKSYFYLDETDNSIYRIRLKTLEEIYADRDSNFESRCDYNFIRTLYVPQMYPFFGSIITNKTTQRTLFKNIENSGDIVVNSWYYKFKDFKAEKIGKKLTLKDNIKNYLDNPLFILLKDSSGNTFSSFYIVKREDSFTIVNSLATNFEQIVYFEAPTKNKDFFDIVKTKLQYLFNEIGFSEKNYKLELYSINDFKWLSLLSVYYGNKENKELFNNCFN